MFPKFAAGNAALERSLFHFIGFGQGFERQFARRIFFQLLNLQLGLRQLALADSGQSRAFLISGQQGFQGQFFRFHSFHDGLQLFQCLFKRQSIRIRGVFLACIPGTIRHKIEAK